MARVKGVMKGEGYVFLVTELKGVGEEGGVRGGDDRVVDWRRMGGDVERG